MYERSLLYVKNSVGWLVDGREREFFLSLRIIPAIPLPLFERESSRQPFACNMLQYEQNYSSYPTTTV